MIMNLLVDRPTWSSFKEVLLRSLGVGWGLSRFDRDALEGLGPRDIARRVVVRLAGGDFKTPEFLGAVAFIETCLTQEISPHGRHAWATALGHVGFELSQAREEIQRLRDTIAAMAEKGLGVQDRVS